MLNNVARFVNVYLLTYSPFSSNTGLAVDPFMLKQLSPKSMGQFHDGVCPTFKYLVIYAFYNTAYYLTIYICFVPGCIYILLNVLQSL